MLFCRTKQYKAHFVYLIHAMGKNGKIGLHEEKNWKILFGIRPSVSLCLASAKIFHFIFNNLFTLLKQYYTSIRCTSHIIHPNTLIYIYIYIYIHSHSHVFIHLNVPIHVPVTYWGEKWGGIKKGRGKKESYAHIGSDLSLHQNLNYNIKLGQWDVAYSIHFSQCKANCAILWFPNAVICSII